MSNKMCVRLGAYAGAFVGLLVAFLHLSPCCASPPGPALSVLDCIVAGLIVAVIVVLFGVAFVMIVRPMPLLPLLGVALSIALIIGVLLSPLAYWIANAALAVLVCGILGALIGWLVCWLLCRGRTLVLEKG